MCEHRLISILSAPPIEGCCARPHQSPHSTGSACASAAANFLRCGHSAPSGNPGTFAMKKMAMRQRGGRSTTIAQGLRGFFTAPRILTTLRLRTDAIAQRRPDILTRPGLAALPLVCELREHLRSSYPGYTSSSSQSGGTNFECREKKQNNVLLSELRQSRGASLLAASLRHLP